jgi:hypothetical protein
MSQRFWRRQLPKEVQLPGFPSWKGSEIPSETMTAVRGAVRDALARRAIADLPAMHADDLDEALDYLVLADRCEFKEEVELEGLLFNTGDAVPTGLSSLGDGPRREIGRGAGTLRITRLYVPEEVKGAVQSVLERST